MKSLVYRLDLVPNMQPFYYICHQHKNLCYVLTVLPSSEKIEFGSNYMSDEAYLGRPIRIPDDSRSTKSALHVSFGNGTPPNENISNSVTPYAQTSVATEKLIFVRDSTAIHRHGRGV